MGLTATASSGLDVSFAEQFERLLGVWSDGDDCGRRHVQHYCEPGGQR